MNEVNITESDEINNKIYDHYHNLIGISHSKNENVENYTFDLPKINDNDLLETYIKIFTFNECYNIIEKMDSSSPG